VSHADDWRKRRGYHANQGQDLPFQGSRVRAIAVVCTTPLISVG
jgi:hypothetical protein